MIAALAGGLNNLIAATADNSSNIQWGGLGTATGASAQSNIDGAANTATIVAALGPGVYAAQLCSDYEVDSQGNTPCQAGNACYNDWFLPSKDQLNQLYLNRAAVGGFASATYWASTEFSANPTVDGWAQVFSSGVQGGDTKNVTHSVRCVRAFTPRSARRPDLRGPSARHVRNTRSVQWMP